MILLACNRGRLDCVLALLRGGSAINTLDKNGRTPLDTAIEQHHQAVFLRFMYLV